MDMKNPTLVCTTKLIFVMKMTHNFESLTENLPRKHLQGYGTTKYYIVTLNKIQIFSEG